MSRRHRKDAAGATLHRGTRGKLRHGVLDRSTKRGDHSVELRAVLPRTRLAGRDEDKRWLAVVDNADDLSWDVSSVRPKGKAGSVIVTSQDAQAARLLGGRTPTVKVDAMEPEEAVRLVLNYFDVSVRPESGCRILVEEITECLDRLALAIDLAGARVQVDVENGDELATALRQYRTDYRRYRLSQYRLDFFIPCGRTCRSRILWRFQMQPRAASLAGTALLQRPRRLL
jgi:hypothetical protein